MSEQQSPGFTAGIILGALLMVVAVWVVKEGAREARMDNFDNCGNFDGCISTIEPHFYTP